MSDDLIHLMIFLGAVGGAPAAAPPATPTVQVQSVIQTPQQPEIAVHRATVARTLSSAQRIAAVPAGDVAPVAILARGRLPENE